MGPGNGTCAVERILPSGARLIARVYSHGPYELVYVNEGSNGEVKETGNVGAGSNIFAVLRIVTSPKDDAEALAFDWLIDQGFKLK